MTVLRNSLPAAYAVVAGLDLNGLGVLRALGGAGVPIVALDTELNKPTATTRFGIKKRIAALSGPEFISGLLTLRTQFGTDPVLLLTQEASVATVSAARDQLRGGYRFTLPNHFLVEELLDKLRFQALAERHGYPIPRAVRYSDDASAEGLRILRFPCVVKPTAKPPEYGKRFAKAYKVSTPDEVSRLWSVMREVVDEVIVQEWIEGSDSDVYFCLQYRPSDRGQSVSFVGRKTSQWPPYVGGTASCMPAAEAASELTDLTDGFFSTVGFIGVCSMEYKRDRRNGKYYFVEPTIGRTDYQEEIAALNGFNIPLVAYCAALGISLPPQKTVTFARAWRDPLGFANVRHAGMPDPTRELSPGIKICDAYLRLSDPMPYAALKLKAARRRVSQLCDLARRVTSTPR